MLPLRSLVAPMAASIMIIVGFAMCSEIATATTTQWLRFEDSSNLMKNTVSGLSVGHLNGTGYGLSGDVAQPVIPLTGDPNTRSLQLTAASWASITQQTFLFHAGQSVDATLEFFFKTSSAGHNESIFWTRSSDSDLNRYNIFLGTGIGIHGDYRAPSGTLHPVSTLSHPYLANSWVHVAIVRTASGSGHKYEWYFNGVLDTSLTFIDASPVLPTETTWSIGGRGGLRYDGLVDEVRSSNTALTPSEFLIGIMPVTVTATTWGRIKTLYR